MVVFAVVEKNGTQSLDHVFSADTALLAFPDWAQLDIGREINAEDDAENVECVGDELRGAAPRTVSAPIQALASRARRTRDPNRVALRR